MELQTFKTDTKETYVTGNGIRHNHNQTYI